MSRGTRKMKRLVTGRRNKGFTLIELMLAMTIFSIVIVLTMESLTRQQKTSIVTEDIVEVQQNLRAVASLMEREIRTAGFMVPNAVGVCGRDRTTGSDELFLSEIEMIVPDDERAGDLGARVVGGWGTGAVAVGTNLTLTLDAATSDLDDDGVFFYDNDNNGTTESDFRDNGGWILADVANPDRGVVCGTVTSSSSTQLRGVVVSGSLGLLAVGGTAEEIVVVPAAHYRVDTTATTGRLLRNNDLLALGVDDLQISFFFDADGDGVVAAANAEEPGSTGTLVYNPLNWDNEELKEVRFSIVVRTRATDVEFDGQGSFITFENRVAPSGGNDGFRRRVLVGAVRPRNIGAAGSI